MTNPNKIDNYPNISGNMPPKKEPDPRTVQALGNLAVKNGQNK